ncbi:hypothetical protein AB0E10_42080 [Streptomyces sp. NPDC048045]|uniref:hypothetical protein n=1 Tax=Streptomyces sp. NPDC048045 TaxID=3154710 RepID=UPI00343C7E22
MRSLRVGQTLAAAGITAAAILTPIATATPAAAAGYYSGCTNFVRAHGYVVGPKVKAACSNKALHLVGWSPNPFCWKGLVEIGVENGVAQGACIRAH